MVSAANAGLVTLLSWRITTPIAGVGGDHFIVRRRYAPGLSPSRRFPWPIVWYLTLYYESLSFVLLYDYRVNHETPTCGLFAVSSLPLGC